MKRLMLVLTVVLVAALALPLTAAAAGPLSNVFDGRIVLGGTYTLGTGETLDGDLLVIGGNVTLEPGSTVRGSVVLIGGNMNAAGTVTRDVAMVGGNVNLGATGVIEGGVAMFGGNLNRADGSRILGQVVTGGQTLQLPPLPTLPSLRVPFTGIPGPVGPVWGIRVTPLWDGFWFFLQALMMGALAVLVVMFGAGPAGRVAKAAVDAPVVSGVVGLLGLVAIPALAVMLMFTICLIPFSIVGLLLFVVAIVYGWIGIGLEVGERLAVLFRWHIDPAAAAGLGTFTLSLVASAINAVPCIGFLAPTLISAWGLGAVLLTRFGRQPYLSAASQLPGQVPPAS